MQSQAYFENISATVILELEEAVHSIRISTPSLTNAAIFEALCRKAQHNVRVELLLGSDKCKAGSGFDFDELRESGGTVITVGNNSRDKVSQLNRFCVIDGEVVITGSYCWAPPEQQKD
jgi:phosphatidylserine/phosphatidylglycerophosphate/cardiolipin synthase-like enzyme